MQRYGTLFARHLKAHLLTCILCNSTVIQNQKSDLHSNFFFQVRWLRDGCEIRKGKKYEMIAEGVKRILLVHKAIFDDEAEYECDAKTSKSSGMLTVVGEFP